MKNISTIRIAILTLLLSMAGSGMSIRAAGLLTLDEVIRLAQQKSYDAQVARFTFLGKYWTYRSFRAELLPSINLSGNLMNFNRSMVEARNYENGQISYVENNSLTNSLTLSIDQNVPLLGGTFLCNRTCIGSISLVTTCVPITRSLCVCAIHSLCALIMN